MSQNQTLKLLRILLTLFFAILAGSTSWALEKNSSTQPNIVFILADDVGRVVLGCYGGTSYQTPHLDKLANDGIRFEHCYSMPVCHPSRTTLLSGKYPRNNGNPAWGSYPDNLESKTFAQILKRAGYKTAIAGKWQLCMMNKKRDHAARLGFEQSSLFGWHEGARYHDPFIYQNGELLEGTEGKYGPDLYVDFLIDFIEKNQQGPFFAYYSMALCHDVTDDLKEPVPYGPRGRYDNFAEMADQMDEEIGKLIAALDRMNLRENTLILFTTDNGTPKKSKLTYDENGKFTYENVVSEFHGIMIPGGKGDLTDWGTRVPLIANWTGHIEGDQVCDDLIDFSDFLPTFAEIASADLPKNLNIDGQSFAKRITSGTASPRQWVSAESRGNKYFYKDHTWKLYNDGRFFNCEKDPFEKKPLNVTELEADAEASYSALSKLISNADEIKE